MLMLRTSILPRHWPLLHKLSLSSALSVKVGGAACVARFVFFLGYRCITEQICRLLSYFHSFWFLPFFHLCFNLPLLFIHSFIHHPFIHPSIHPFIHPFIHLSTIHSLFIHPSFTLRVYICILMLVADTRCVFYCDSENYANCHSFCSSLFLVRRCCLCEKNSHSDFPAGSTHFWSDNLGNSFGYRG